MFWRFFTFDSRGTATLVTAIITAVIGVATLTPLPTAIDAPGSDKLHHFIAFAALSYPASAHIRRFSWPIVLASAAFGGAIEIIQPYVNRSGEFLDFAADCVVEILVDVVFVFIISCKVVVAADSDSSLFAVVVVEIESSNAV